MLVKEHNETNDRNDFIRAWRLAIAQRCASGASKVFWSAL
jgi:hypothetical protein